MIGVAEKAERRKQIKKIESHLENYIHYKVGLKNLQEQLDFIMPNITATYELIEGSSGVFNIHSKTEKYAIDRIESKRALLLNEEIELYKMLITSIDRALAELDELEREFVKLRYMEKKSYLQTAMELRYSEKHIYNLRNRILDKLLISLKGIIQF